VRDTRCRIVTHSEESLQRNQRVKIIPESRNESTSNTPFNYRFDLGGRLLHKTASLSSLQGPLKRSSLGARNQLGGLTGSPSRTSFETHSGGSGANSTSSSPRAERRRVRFQRTYPFSLALCRERDLLFPARRPPFTNLSPTTRSPATLKNTTRLTRSTPHFYRTDAAADPGHLPPRKFSRNARPQDGEETNVTPF